MTQTETLAEAVNADSHSNPLWCKICGITTREDALMAEQAGADALGFVFYARSKRCISVPQAAAIAAGLSATKVGLFVDADKTEVLAAMQRCDLDLLQFHGRETPAYCEQFKMPYMKALRAGEAGETVEGLTRRVHSYDKAWAVLLDAYVPGVAGGTGQLLNLKLWPQLVTKDVKLVLAGGLTAQNVATAVAEVAAIQGELPFGVDVSSGVEMRHNGDVMFGRKDAEAVREFIQEVKHVQ